MVVQVFLGVPVFKRGGFSSAYSSVDNSLMETLEKRVTGVQFALFWCQALDCKQVVQKCSFWNFSTSVDMKLCFLLHNFSCLSLIGASTYQSDFSKGICCVYPVILFYTRKHWLTLFLEGSRYCTSVTLMCYSDIGMASVILNNLSSVCTILLYLF